MNISDNIKQIRLISKELKELSDKLKHENHPNYHNKAREIINSKYGKGWREDLTVKDISENPQNYQFGKMSHY